MSARHDFHFVFIIGSEIDEVLEGVGLRARHDFYFVFIIRH